jgi:hypothetical protein
MFYCARLGLKLEQRTAEWFDLALSRELQESIDGASAGVLVRQLRREENPGAILKAWDGRKLLGSLFPALGRRKPNMEDFGRLAKAREGLWGAGIRPRLFTTVAHYLVDRLASRDQAAAMKHWGFSAAESTAVQELPTEAHKFRKLLQGRKMRAPEDAYRLLVQTPPTLLAFVLTEWSTSGAAMRIRNYLTKWHPLRLNLPVAELSALGLAHGPKFDEVIEKFFVMQLRGKARDPEERPQILKKLAGIKDEPPKKLKPEKGRRKDKDAPSVPQARDASSEPAAKAKPGAKPSAITANKKGGASSKPAAGSKKPRKKTTTPRKRKAAARKTRERSVPRKGKRGTKVRKNKRKKGGKKRGGKRR